MNNYVRLLDKYDNSNEDTYNNVNILVKTILSDNIRVDGIDIEITDTGTHYLVDSIIGSSLNLEFRKLNPNDSVDDIFKKMMRYDITGDSYIRSQITINQELNKLKNDDVMILNEIVKFGFMTINVFNCAIQNLYALCVTLDAHKILNITDDETFSRVKRLYNECLMEEMFSPEVTDYMIHNDYLTTDETITSSNAYNFLIKYDLFRKYYVYRLISDNIEFIRQHANDDITLSYINDDFVKLSLEIIKSLFNIDVENIDDMNSEQLYQTVQSRKNEFYIGAVRTTNTDTPNHGAMICNVPTFGLILCDDVFMMMFNELHTPDLISFANKRNESLIDYFIITENFTTPVILNLDHLKDITSDELMNTNDIDYLVPYFIYEVIQENSCVHTYRVTGGYLMTSLNFIIMVMIMMLVVIVIIILIIRFSRFESISLRKYFIE